MNGFGQWLRNLGMKLNAGFRNFMMGRYGTDKLNTCILGAGVIVCLVSLFMPWAIVKLILTLVSYGLMFFEYILHIFFFPLSCFPRGLAAVSLRDEDVWRRNGVLQELGGG